MWLQDGVGARLAGRGTGSGPSEGPLASLVGDRLARRFCAWRGASGHRYITSIFPLEPASADLGLPSFEHFVLIAVAADTCGRRILFATSVERGGDRRRAVVRARAEGADEWHVHFLGETPGDRQAAVRDLERRHVMQDEATPRVA